MIEILVPDRLNIDKDDRELYNEIQIFKNKENKEKFLFAMAYGFINKVKYPIKKKDGFILNSYLRPEDEALLYSLAVTATDSVNILLDLQKIYEIAEEYARGGLKLLHDESLSSQRNGSLTIKLEKDLFEILKGNG